jgi:hypothetical protein
MGLPGKLLNVSGLPAQMGLADDLPQLYDSDSPRVEKTGGGT